MPRVTPISTRASGHHGASLPPRDGGGRGDGGTSSSFFYILTAMHGLHLAGGVLALLCANVAAVLHRPVETRRIVVDVASWYWHCMTGLWIYILLLFSFAAQ